MDIFDIIGPIMIGPSSSHTAGAARLGKVARQLFGEPPLKVVITLFGSFAKTGKGHGTLKAILAGLCGFEMDDERMRDIYDLCNFDYEFLVSENEDYHPNTAVIEMARGDEHMRVRGSSVGGGNIEINGINHMPVTFTDNNNTLILFHKDRMGLLADITRWLKKREINIASMRVFRLEQGQDAITIIETDTAIPNYDDMAQIPDIFKVVWFEKEKINDEDRMFKILSVMRESIQCGLEDRDKTESGMAGGDAFLMKKAMDRGDIPDELINRAALYAMAVSEENARMGRIVAAPTAGASGITPGVLVALGEENKFDDKMLVDALFVAGNIGLYIARYATLSGAKGGCQAECGSAIAMAAAAAVFLFGGDEEKQLHAAALALQSVLGLACDPVAGLVEVPCIKRNANLTSIAITSANMALSGITSFIPFNEVVGAMKQIGSALPGSLKETADGGLAITPTGKSVRT